jgi:hypothetical protein
MLVKIVHSFLPVQIKVLYQSGFTDAERAEFRRIVHTNVYQSVRVSPYFCLTWAVEI